MASSCIPSNLASGRGHGLARVLVPAVVAGLLLVAGRLEAADAAKAPAGGAPASGATDATAVIRRFIEATGGEAAIRKNPTRLTVGSFEAPTLGISGTMEMLQSVPRRMSQKLLIGAGMTMTMTTDGKAAWIEVPSAGVQTMDGLQRDQFIEEGDLLGYLEFPKRYTNAVVKPSVKVGDVECVAVTGTSRIGKSETMYFYKDSENAGLLYRWDRPKIGPNGEWADTETYYEKYRDVDGLKIPFKISQKVPADQAFILTLTTVKHGVEAPDDRFKAASP